MRHSLQLAAAATLLWAIPTAASASVNLVNNGSFEQPVISDPCCNTVPPDSLPGWTVNSGDINVVNGTYAGASSPGPNLAYEGAQYLDLVGQSSTGDISQFLNTVAGQVYTLTFAYSNNIFSGAAAASAEVTIGTLDAIITHNTATTTDLDWSIFTGTFVGTGSPMELEFASILGDQNGSIFLDAISVSATPEPGTWLMMILGFGLAGGAIRRRKRQLALA
jgi:hypothetical protein